MKYLMFVLATLFLCLTANAADLKTSFNQLERISKGAFGKNMLQGSAGSRQVLAGSPPGTLQFQAAYRNEVAQALANQDFYVGNLFTTNYYELMGEYVYGNRQGSHGLDHEALISSGPAALAKATSMIRHWNLEKQYVRLFPLSALSKGFRVRGVSGSEFEQEYARYFFNYYLSVLEDESQYLPVVLLARGSPIADSNSLDTARQYILQIYEWSLANYGEADARSRRLYQLRNHIHNQLSQSVIGQIDQFIKDYPSVAEDALRQTRQLIAGYYTVDTKTIATSAMKAGLLGLKNIMDGFSKKKPSVQDLFDLSQGAAAVRQAILDEGVFAPSKKADTLIVLIAVSQYLNKELSTLKELNSPLVARALLNLIYVEGFLLTDNWIYFSNEMASAPDLKAAIGQIPDIIGIASDTLSQSMSPSLDQWVSLEPKMQIFLDNTIKSSALNTASVIAQKVSK